EGAYQQHQQHDREARPPQRLLERIGPVRAHDFWPPSSCGADGPRFGGDCGGGLGADGLSVDPGAAGGLGATGGLLDGLSVDCDGVDPAAGRGFTGEGFSVEDDFSAAGGVVGGLGAGGLSVEAGAATTPGALAT